MVPLPNYPECDQIARVRGSVVEGGENCRFLPAIPSRFADWPFPASMCITLQDPAKCARQAARTREGELSKSNIDSLGFVVELVVKM